jgi:hypothetical protein
MYLHGHLMAAGGGSGVGEVGVMKIAVDLLDVALVECPIQLQTR